MMETADSTGSAAASIRLTETLTAMGINETHIP